MPNKIHLTVATVIERDAQFLMVKETKAGVQVINQPAGHVEVGEDILQAALRETMEETGWEVSITVFLGISTHFAQATGITYYRLTFVAQPVRQDSLAVIDADIDMPLWMTFEEIREEEPRLRSDMVLKCIEDYLAGRIFPLDIFRNRL